VCANINITHVRTNMHKQGVFSIARRFYALFQHHTRPERAAYDNKVRTHSKKQRVLMLCCALSLEVERALCVITRHGGNVGRVGQNHVYTLYMTIYLVMSLPKVPYTHRTYMVLANPKYGACGYKIRVPHEYQTGRGMTCIGRLVMSKVGHLAVYTHTHTHTHSHTP